MKLIVLLACVTSDLLVVNSISLYTRSNDTEKRDVFRVSVRLENLSKHASLDAAEGTHKPVFPAPSTTEEHAPYPEEDHAKKQRKRRRKPCKKFPCKGYFPPGYAAGVGSFYKPQSYGLNPTYNYGAAAPGVMESLSLALGSIAKFDDFKCVPRLLCEVASGSEGGLAGESSGGIGTSWSTLSSFLSLQPLISLLASFKGATSSPLFLFGQAAILGMTSKGNAANCRYAYPQCPSEPEKLLEYLNNHKGGFFRYVNAANSVAPPNLESWYQYYNKIGQTPNYNINQLPFMSFDERFSHYNQHNMDLNTYNPYVYQNPYAANSFGQPQNGDGQYRLETNAYNRDNYDKSNKIDENTEIQKRIQNNPLNIETELIRGQDLFDDSNAIWTFPDQIESRPDNIQQDVNYANNYKTFKFPSENPQKDKNARINKGIKFPDTNTNKNYVNRYKYPLMNQPINWFIRTVANLDSSDHKMKKIQSINENLGYLYSNDHNKFVKFESNNNDLVHLNSNDHNLISLGTNDQKLVNFDSNDHNLVNFDLNDHKLVNYDLRDQNLVHFDLNDHKVVNHDSSDYKLVHFNLNDNKLLNYNYPKLINIDTNDHKLGNFDSRDNKLVNFDSNDLKIANFNYIDDKFKLDQDQNANGISTNRGLSSVKNDGEDVVFILRGDSDPNIHT